MSARWSPLVTSICRHHWEGSGRERHERSSCGGPEATAALGARAASRAARAGRMTTMRARCAGLLAGRRNELSVAGVSKPWPCAR